MKWTYETYDQKERRLSRWHKYFCWFPKSYNGTTYWLCFVERKVILNNLFGDYYYYREIEK